MTDEGLVLGAGSLLVRMTKHASKPVLALEADRERLLALLSVATGAPIDGVLVFEHVRVASTHWQRGDKALANLRLAFAKLPNLREPADVDRLSIAEHLLDAGFTPTRLMRELWPDDCHHDLGKFREDEPRVPAGSGDESGRWTREPNGGGAPAPKRADAIIVAEEGPPESEKEYEEHRRLGESTIEEEASHGAINPAGVFPAGVGLGPFAGKFVPAGPRAQPATTTRQQINTIGRDTGCHTCGTKDPGTKTGNFICDHQKPNALNEAGARQVYLPHCLSCSRSQGGLVTKYKFSR